MIENSDRFMVYRPDNDLIQQGTHLTDITLENVKFINLKEMSNIKVPAEQPLTVRLKNVHVSMANGSAETLFDANEPNLLIIQE